MSPHRVRPASEKLIVTSFVCPLSSLRVSLVYCPRVGAVETSKKDLCKCIEDRGRQRVRQQFSSSFKMGQNAPATSCSLVLLHIMRQGPIVCVSMLSMLIGKSRYLIMIK